MEEIIEKRGRRSKTFNLGGKRRRVEIGSHSHTRKGGIWLPTDTAVEPETGLDAEVGMNFIARSRFENLDYDIRFGKNDPVWMKIKHTDSGKTVVFNPRGNNARPDHVIQGNKILVSNAWDGIDMEIFVTDLGVKTNYIITSMAGQRVVEFAVRGDIRDFSVGAPFYRKAEGGFVFPPKAFSAGVLSYDFRNVPIGTVIDPSVEIQEGYPTAAGNGFDPVYTTTVRGGTGFPYMEMGSNASLWGGGSGSAAFVLRIPVTDVPASSVITSSTLTMTTDYVNGTGNKAQLRRCLKNWVPDQTTWNNYATGNAWDTAGCRASTDREDTVSATSETVSGVGSFDTTGAGMDADIQAWVDGTTNNGWYITSDNASGQQEFLGPGFSTAASRPKLVVEYTAADAAYTGTVYFRNTNSVFGPKLVFPR